MGQQAHESGRLDLVKFIPAAQPPHKRSRQLASERQRLHMLRLAIANDRRFEIDDLEIRRGGRSYSVDTVQALREREPEARFTFIIGADSLAELHLWRDIERLARMCRFLAIARPGIQLVPPAAELGIRYRVVSGCPVGISSRDIRRRCRAGRSIRYLVPGPVAAYIKQQKLYR